MKLLHRTSLLSLGCLLASSCAAAPAELGKQAPNASVTASAPATASALASDASVSKTDPGPETSRLGKRSVYAPLPDIEACSACPWPGTGCTVGGDKRCALDKAAYWKVWPERVKPAEPIGTMGSFCISGAAGQTGCGVPSSNKAAGFTSLTPESPSQRFALLSSEELLGVYAFTVTSYGRGVLGVVTPSLKVDAALFARDGGALVSNSDGDLIQVGIELAQPPPELPARMPSLFPQRGLASARSPELFQKAVEIANKARAIDANLGDLRRQAALTHRRSGFEIRLVAFFRGDKLVKLLTQHPYLPPLVDMAFYFENEQLILVRTSTFTFATDEQGEPEVLYDTSYRDERGLVWCDDPTFDPTALTRNSLVAGGSLVSEVKKALKDPDYHLAEDVL
jgi:hypothetical protein